ncbi:soluble NSF attachment protein receptor [Ochromonadaceae sp. CCMP2298]|nr:soluble NSF attachment protein receptor [Ochromonadaceae sp. CCMP2298]
MIVNLYVARVIDGLVLVASMDHASTSGSNMDVYKGQAKQLLKKLNPRSTAKMSIETNPYIFHYMIEKGICYLTLTEKSYPKRLAFLFLEEISRDFEADLHAEYGDDWLHTVETVGRQYAFIKFDRVIQRKRRDYLDPNSSSNMKKLNDDLQSIHSIMRKTIDDVLDRGNKLDDVSEISKNLANESKKYKWGAKQLSMMVCVAYCIMPRQQSVAAIYAWLTLLFP